MRYRHALDMQGLSRTAGSIGFATIAGNSRSCHLFRVGPAAGLDASQTLCPRNGLGNERRQGSSLTTDLPLGRRKQE